MKIALCIIINVNMNLHIYFIVMGSLILEFGLSLIIFPVE